MNRQKDRHKVGHYANQMVVNSRDMKKTVESDGQTDGRNK